VTAPFVLVSSDGVFGRFDLAALRGCHNLNDCLFVLFVTKLCNSLDGRRLANLQTALVFCNSLDGRWRPANLQTAQHYGWLCLVTNVMCRAARVELEGCNLLGSRPA
jgi:hypothetical protein